ncbi:hypothetical protein [Burkholderia diffusa]|uniref:hypothetical protein n=1 Tax=Burkholderia diffusa TaxID=488732 RepID=UPI0018C8D2E3|nr:hypothetical protein [Burkholderia diffusa]
MSPKKSIRITRIRPVGFPLAIVVVVLSIFYRRVPIGILASLSMPASSLGRSRHRAASRAALNRPRLFAHAMSPPAGGRAVAGAASASRATDCIASG